GRCVVLLVSCVEDCIFFFSVAAATEIYTLSLHDALPILRRRDGHPKRRRFLIHRSPGPHFRSRSSIRWRPAAASSSPSLPVYRRSEEHTSELQSRENLVCRLLLEKKKNYLSGLHLGLLIL